MVCSGFGTGVILSVRTVCEGFDGRLRFTTMADYGMVVRSDSVLILKKYVFR